MRWATASKTWELQQLVQDAIRAVFRMSEMTVFARLREDIESL
jgi:hypothetical protein